MRRRRRSGRGRRDVLSGGGDSGGPQAGGQGSVGDGHHIAGPAGLVEGVGDGVDPLLVLLVELLVQASTPSRPRRRRPRSSPPVPQSNPSVKSVVRSPVSLRRLAVRGAWIDPAMPVTNVPQRPPAAPRMYPATTLATRRPARECRDPWRPPDTDFGGGGDCRSLRRILITTEVGERDFLLLLVAPLLPLPGLLAALVLVGHDVHDVLDLPWPRRPTRQRSGSASSFAVS